MVVRWLRRREPGWRRGLPLNFIGMCLTGVVFVVFGASKLLEGAWVVLLIIPTLVMVFRAINRHYSDVAVQVEADTSIRPDHRPRHVHRADHRPQRHRLRVPGDGAVLLPHRHRRAHLRQPRARRPAAGQVGCLGQPRAADDHRHARTARTSARCSPTSTPSTASAPTTRSSWWCPSSCSTAGGTTSCTTRPRCASRRRCSSAGARW